MLINNQQATWYNHIYLIPSPATPMPSPATTMLEPAIPTDYKKIRGPKSCNTHVKSCNTQ
jgi:hypothetical protein